MGSFSKAGPFQFGKCGHVLPEGTIGTRAGCGDRLFSGYI
jgi:hypothetical protein